MDGTIKTFRSALEMLETKRNSPGGLTDLEAVLYLKLETLVHFAESLA